jgi:hypothetical protein
MKMKEKKVPARCPTHSYLLHIHTDLTLETRQDHDELWENWEGNTFILYLCGVTFQNVFPISLL